MVALVDKHMAVFGDKVFHFLIAMEALDDRNVNLASALCFTCTDLSDLINREVKKHCQSLPPLIEQLLPMNDDKRVDVPVCNEPRGYGGLSKGSGCAEKSIIMADDGGNGLLLLFAKRTVELDFNRRSKQPLILHDGLDSMSIEQCDQLRDATPRKSQVPSHILAATNDSRLVEGGEPHSLRFVELWILECGDSQDPIHECWRQVLLLDIDEIGSDH